MLKALVNKEKHQRKRKMSDEEDFIINEDLTNKK